VAAYDPFYSMPGRKTFKLSVNIPPKSCQLIINPKTGVELETLFTI
jgi:hypothetical protein